MPAPPRKRRPAGAARTVAGKAREHTDRALEVLVESMGDADARIRFTAAKEVLERGWGKPLTSVADIAKRLDEFSDDDLEAGIAFLRKALGLAEKAAGGAGKTGAD